MAGLIHVMNSNVLILLMIQSKQQLREMFLLQLAFLSSHIEKIDSSAFGLRALKIIELAEGNEEIAIYIANKISHPFMK